MAHRRKSIREAIKKALRDKTLASERVFTNSATVAWQGELPVILIYPKSEAAEEYAVAPRELRRELQVTIECIASGPEEPLVTEGKETVEDLLDTLAEQVECELSRDDTLGCTADDIILVGTEFEFDASGSQSIGSCRLTYQVTYHQKVPDTVDKQAGIEDFKRSHSDWHVGHEDEDPDLANKEATDDVDIP
jgi:hypothetical protein